MTQFQTLKGHLILLKLRCRASGILNGVVSYLYPLIFRLQLFCHSKYYCYQVPIILCVIFHFFVQRELFAAKADSGGGAVDRKLSSSSAGSMKNKWLKAFRSLKPPSAPPPHAAPPDKYVFSLQSFHFTLSLIIIINKHAIFSTKTATRKSHNYVTAAALYYELRQMQSK